MPLNGSAVNFDGDKVEQSTVRVTLLDKRSYAFDFESRHDANRFEFNIVECQKFYENGNSSYVKNKRYESNLRPFFTDWVNPAAGGKELGANNVK